VSSPTQNQAVQVYDITPDVVGNRNVAAVARSDSMSVLVHVWGQGGETAMHSHRASDANWLILQGQVTFYGEGDAVLARLERNQGIFIPHDVKYWFENSGAEQLIMVRSAAKLEPGVGDDRVYHAGHGA
jgi:mannose-6-phosphate isomerase-like protein (cupin superfamily)